VSGLALGARSFAGSGKAGKAPSGIALGFFEAYKSGCSVWQIDWRDDSRAAAGL